MKWGKFFGFLLQSWAVPFIVSCFFFAPPPPDSPSLRPQLMIDKIFFQTIMLMVGGVTGAYSMLKSLQLWFEGVTFAEDEATVHLVRAGSTKVGVLFFLFNAVMDILILIPLSGMSLTTYFMEIGFRYLNMINTCWLAGSFGAHILLVKSQNLAVNSAAASKKAE